jgi:acyl-CoA oxidase
MAGLEMLAFVDYSLAIKAGVHFTLCGGTLCKLGTKMHHDEYLHRLDDLSLPGCFGMTELGHGSNVMGIETTAEYDRTTQEFIINTPSDDASKYWIGGAAQHGKVWQHYHPHRCSCNICVTFCFCSCAVWIGVTMQGLD